MTITVDTAVHTVLSLNDMMYHCLTVHDCKTASYSTTVNVVKTTNTLSVKLEHIV